MTAKIDTLDIWGAQAVIDSMDPNLDMAFLIENHFPVGRSHGMKFRFASFAEKWLVQIHDPECSVLNHGK